MLRHKTMVSTLVALTLASVPALAVQRAFVSSAGSDANPCTPTAPCRGFQAAHNVVDAGGEIVALDAAGYGQVTITKSLSIIGNPGFVVGISAATGYGVAIDTPGVNVVLRHLSIHATGGFTGVRMTAGNSLTVEDCDISGFSNQGIYVGTAAEVRIADTSLRRNDSGMAIENNATADIVRSRFIGNSTFGLAAFGSASGTTSASVSDSVASGNNSYGFVVVAERGTGVAQLSVIRSTASNNHFAGFSVLARLAGATARMTVGASIASGNDTGFAVSLMNGGTGILESMGDNIVRQNTTASVGTITAVSGL